MDIRKVFMKKKKTPFQKKVAVVLREFKKGELKSGKSGRMVKDPKQALAIALSEGRRRAKHS